MSDQTTHDPVDTPELTEMVEDVPTEDVLHPSKEKPVKFGVYTIVKNEAKHIKRWAEAAKDADARVVVDTGSTDNTVALAKEAGCTVFEIKVDPWRFDVARNKAMELLPEGIDWWIAVDADEVLVGDWRSELQKVPENATNVQYQYVWSWHSPGVPDVSFIDNNCHRPGLYRWKYPVHETLEYIGNAREISGEVNAGIHHHPDPNKPRSQYLPLLELAGEEFPDDPRIAHYLAREYMFYGKKMQAITHFKRHLEMVTSVDLPERCSSYRYLSVLDPANAEHWLIQAIRTAPFMREPYYELALIYHTQENYFDCYRTAMAGLELEERGGFYMEKAIAWTHGLHDLVTASAVQLGLVTIAKTHAKLALDACVIEADLPRLQSNHDKLSAF